MPSDWLVPAIGLAAALALIWPFLRRQRRLEQKSREAELQALRYGLDQPSTLHPVVDATRCIGSGNCVNVCPEGDVLGLIDGQATAIGPAMCIGHGLCERRCPVDAIQLVFGSETRGVDLPRIKENFETNVPDLYVVGELGGMGLVGNAVEQGRQCVEGFARRRAASQDPDVLDVLIVGCGPAGLSAALACQEAGLRYVVVEKEDVGGTVRHYPRKKMVLTRPVELPLYGKLKVREIQKEDLIDLWTSIVADTGLQVATGETVETVHRAGDRFTVRTSARRLEARRVILAIGRRGVPRKLGVPGEELAKVAYSLREPEAFRGDRLLVVGGGDSAVEAALDLSEDPANDVKVSYRGDQFRRVKPKNRERIQGAIGAGRLEVLWSTNVAEIRPDAVLLRNGDPAAPRVVPNDYTFIFAGGELPTTFLQGCGVQIDTKFGEA
ncbi:MAG: NAD(P)-binding domain-containing protein [Gemmatimonadales bacterium]|jgi:thioredoxin reductase/NAD-dependent dihydropyrimidine dehydrogenase PreA subunit